MDDQRWCAYAGVYQAFAWQQGFAGQPVTFRLPEDFWVRQKFEEEVFDVSAFMSVVRDIDDTGIHYWRFYEVDGDRFLSLACTEDRTAEWLPADAKDKYHTAYEEFWKEVK